MTLCQKAFVNNVNAFLVTTQDAHPWSLTSSALFAIIHNIGVTCSHVGQTPIGEQTRDEQAGNQVFAIKDIFPGSM